MDAVHVRREVRPGRPLARLVAGLEVAAGLGLLWLCFGHLLPPFDLDTFLHAGRQVAAGKTPYSSVSSPTFASGHAFVYPAFVAWLFAPLALVPAVLAVPLYTTLSVASVFVAARWLGHRDLHAPMLVMVSSATIVAFQMGTVNPVLLVGVAAAWRWRTTRPVLSGVLLGIVAGFKLFLAPLLLWPVMRRRYRSTAAAAATLLGILAVQVPLGHIGISRYATMLSRLQRAETAQSWSVASLVHHLGAGTHTSVVTFTLGAACLAVLASSRDRLSDRQLLGLTVVVCLLVSPIVWSSYLLLMAIPLLLLSDSNVPLAVAAMGSWVIVTPDQASGTRVAIGVGTAAVVAYLAVRPNRFLPRPGAEAAASGAALTAVAGCLFLLVPDPVRSPLPALAAITMIAAWALRRPAAGRLPVPTAD